MGVAAAQKVERILEIDTGKKTVEEITAAEDAFEGIRFEQVYFSYKTGNQVLKNISLEIPKNKTVAIAGESGYGKST